jgi:hypothetical protein
MRKGPGSVYDKWNISVVIFKQIFHSGQTSHGFNRNIIEVMTLPNTCYSNFSFICIFCRSLFILLYFFSFGHCVFYSSIYGFGLPLLYHTLLKGTLISVASWLAASSIKDIMIGATSSGISYHLRDIYSIWSFNFTFRYNDDVHSLNNSVDRTYHIEPEIKDTTDTDKSASSLDLVKIKQNWRIFDNLFALMM